jgi:hypothetical protein
MAVPSKQSSPPAEKCGVCIGVTPASQAEMAEKRAFGLACGRNASGAICCGNPSGGFVLQKHNQ